jgi:plasmid stabilization system protein ParE
MTYRVTILARAQQDVDETFDWIAARSHEGARRWLSALDEAIESLRANPFLAPVAPEAKLLKIEVRHVLFRTRRGRTYRAIFIVNDDEVRILRVRAPGQPPVKPRDITV